MTPNVERPRLPPNTPTRADASVVTAAQRQPRVGESLITNSAIGRLQTRARTSRTTNTGGGTR